MIPVNFMVSDSGTKGLGFGAYANALGGGARAATARMVPALMLDGMRP